MWLALMLAVAPTEAARAYSMLAYVKGDYASAVGASGEVLSRQELDEQRLFAREAADDLRAAGAADLAAQVDQLAARVGQGAPPREVVPLAYELAARVAQRFQLALLPRRQPDLERGRTLYSRACAACHGSEGSPQVAALELSTTPTAFSSKQEIARLSPQRIFAAVNFGVPGTAMPSFAGAVDENAVWDVAYAVLLFARTAAEIRRGEEIARTLPRRPDWLQLAVRTDEQLRATLAQSPFTPADREALLSAIRSAWSEPALPQAAHVP
jgi:mono/diheme cytochrome c family protein